MPQLQVITLTDRQTAPKTHTFNPENITGNVGSLVENKDVPVGNPRYTISLRKTAKVYRAQVKFTVPVVSAQLVNGISTPVVVRTTRINAEFEFSNLSTEAERADAVGMFYSSLAAAQPLTNGVIVKLEGVY